VPAVDGRAKRGEAILEAMDAGRIPARCYGANKPDVKRAAVIAVATGCAV
jgi:hypothetical protein